MLNSHISSYKCRGNIQRQSHFQSCILNFRRRHKRPACGTYICHPRRKRCRHDIVRIKAPLVERRSNFSPPAFHVHHYTRVTAAVGLGKKYTLRRDMFHADSLRSPSQHSNIHVNTQSRHEWRNAPSTCKTGQRRRTPMKKVGPKLNALPLKGGFHEYPGSVLQ